MNTRPIDILLVEDNAGDARLTKEAFRDSKLLNSLHHVIDGEQALSYLRREDEFWDAIRPDIVLLDLNLPKKDGREVLNEIKQDPNLKAIPVVVLTTSQADEDIAKCYMSHANCYITKPVDLDRFMYIVQSIEDFWLTVVKLPRGAHDGS